MSWGIVVGKAVTPHSTDVIGTACGTLVHIISTQTRLHVRARKHTLPSTASVL